MRRRRGISSGRSGSITSSIAAVERRAQLFLTDGVRAGVRTSSLKPTHTGFQRARSPTPGSPRIPVARHRRGRGTVRSPARSRTCAKRSSRSVGRSELNLDPTVVGLHRAIASAVSTSMPRTENPAKRRGDVLARPAARIEHRSGNRLRLPNALLPAAAINVPRRRAVEVRSIPGQSRQPFVTRWVPTTERIVRRVPDCSDNFAPFVQLMLPPHRATPIPGLNRRDRIGRWTWPRRSMTSRTAGSSRSKPAIRMPPRTSFDDYALVILQPQPAS